VSNLAKITDKIIGEAKEYEESVMAQARKEASAISREYEARAEETENAILERGRKSVTAVLSRAESSSAMIKRNAVLEMKKSLADEVYRKAEEKLVAVPQEKFTEFLMKVLIKAAQPGIDGEIAFNARDKEKFGADFVAAANKKIKGGKFTLSETAADIKNGFILKYGAVDTNCSIEKIVEAKKAETEPKIINLLFGGDN
jgi:V/A-type H+-transporting ATPase subunit E